LKSLTRALDVPESVRMCDRTLMDAETGQTRIINMRRSWIIA
jgi:hypothetical protein